MVGTLESEKMAKENNKIPKQPLREIMLDIHEKQIKKIYGIPSKCKLSYNQSSTQILVDYAPLFCYLSDRLMQPTFLKSLAAIRQERLSKLLEAHGKWKEYSSDQIFNLQFDYEMLSLDHLVDENRVNTLLQNSLNNESNTSWAKSVMFAPSSGKTFFEEVKIKELESLGYMLRNEYLCHESFFFGSKDFDHFCRYTIARNKLIRIILDNDNVVLEMRKRYENLCEIYPHYDSAKDVYLAIKDIRKEQMKRRCSIVAILSDFEEHQQRYLKFVTDAFDYNEENRLLRSVSFYHIMKDKTIPARFNDLIGGRRNGF